MITKRDKLFESVRKIKKDNNTWYCAKDVANVLGYDTNSNLSGIFSHLREDWKGIISNNTPGGKQQMLYISREGLNFFLERSKKEIAREFQEWLAGPVLTSIEDIGGFIDPDRANEFTNPDTIRQIIEISNTRTRELEEANKRANTAERFLKTAKEEIEFDNVSIHDLKRIIDASDSEAKRIADQATFEAQAYKREKDIAWERIDSLQSNLSKADQRISYLESKLSENNIAYSDTHPKVEMCRVVDNTHKKTNIMDIINGYKGE